MKLRSSRLPLVLATVAVATLGLAACSSSSSDSSGSASSSSAAKSTPTAAAATYTADDLTAIVTAADKTLGTSGKILDDADIKKATSSLGSGGLSSILDQDGLTITPAACKAKVKEGLANTQTATGYVAADLVYADTNTVGVSTTPGKALPSSASDSGARLESLLADCSDMKLTISGQSIDLKIAKSTATTKADTTTAIDETLTIPAGTETGTVTMTLISAVQGNLAVVASGVTKSNVSSLPAPAAGTPSLSDAVDAVLDAAAAQN